MNFHIMTLFPEIIDSYSGESIIKKGREKGLISVESHNIRDYSENKHKKVDDYPFGGGAGMVMTVQPIMSCFNSIKDNLNGSCKVIYVSPRGKVFNQKKAKELSNFDNVVILCGHYEGVDQRAIDLIVDEEVSIGDYVLTGGELPALIIMDAVSRLIKGVLGSEESYMDESHSNYLLEYPQYTRPRNYEGLEVPEVLVNGNHKHILKWQKEESLKITFERRKDMLRRAKLSREDELIVENLRKTAKSTT